MFHRSILFVLILMSTALIVPRKFVPGVVPLLPVKDQSELTPEFIGTQTVPFQ